MKNNLLTEITHIKKLMGINEASNDACESQLEDDGWVVYSPTEQVGQVEACEGKQKIKCVKEWMENNGVDDNKITVDAYKGACYLMFKSSTNIKLGDIETPDETWLFWQSGDLSHINTFGVKQDIPTEGKSYGQYHYSGKFECDGNDLKSKDMKYLGVYEVDKYSKLIKNKKFMVKDAAGKDVRDVDRLVATSETFNSSTFEN